MHLAVGQPIVAAAGFQPAGFSGRAFSRRAFSRRLRLRRLAHDAKRPPERRLRAGLPAPQNRQDFMGLVPEPIYTN
jgi:hypothetical protein